MQEQKLMWRQQAACRDSDTNVFFPDSDADAGPALAICAVCPVRIECLEYAVRIREPHGIWGGLNELERRRLIRDVEQLRAGL